MTHRAGLWQELLGKYLVEVRLQDPMLVVPDQQPLGELHHSIVLQTRSFLQKHLHRSGSRRRNRSRWRKPRWCCGLQVQWLSCGPLARLDLHRSGGPRGTPSP